jgi:hypothetical protein
MPTFGWVREDAIEAFLAGTEKFEYPSLPPVKHYACPFCSFMGDTINDLHDHVYRKHKIERPILLMNGRECESEAVIRSKQLFTTTNVKSASLVVDGKSAHVPTTAEIDVFLSNCRQNIVILTLTNGSEAKAAPVLSSYRLDFRIAEPSILAHVEAAFLEKIVEAPLSMDAVSRFLGDSRSQGLGSEYANGLAAYVTGVLVKERPEGQAITSPLDRYRELFGISLQSLNTLSRPFSRLVCAVIHFALNDISAVGKDTGYLELDVATRMLEGIADDPILLPELSEMDSVARRRVCPIDHGTGRILDLAIRMARQDRWSKTLSDEFRQVAEAASLDSIDRQKAVALWAVTAMRLGASDAAVEPLAQLSATYPFSVWASVCLEKVSKS